MSSNEGEMNKTSQSALDLDGLQRAASTNLLSWLQINKIQLIKILKF